VSKVEPLPYDDRTVYSVAAFNRGVAQWLSRLPTVWVEGEVTELRRHERWASVFFTLKDPSEGASIGVTMPRGRFDGLRLDTAGRIWAATDDGVHCITPDGTLIGKVRVAEEVANVVFGGPGRDRLFICATSSLYAVQLAVRGA
jgi:gluconolactonase